MTKTPPSHKPQLPQLPVLTVLPDLCDALRTGTRAVLSAPPGAGKTTLVPLALLHEAWCAGKIIMLEPRRLAARAAARRMADLLGETPGETVGYRMRLDSRVCAHTRVEVVTEGVFARMVLERPDLNGISMVIFDEFHERSLEADFGLALALDVQAGLREDLRVLVMSATLDTERVAELLDRPPVIISEGRSFPVEVQHRERTAGERIEDSMARAIITAHGSQRGSILAFLPGQGEVLRTAERLEGKLDPATTVVPLYGNLDQKTQDLAVQPAAPGRRKIVLATSIAETSITIDGVRIVIDSGLQRLPVFEPATGTTRLETVRVSRASAEQRAGRAGRTEAGTAIRLWHAGQTAALRAFTPPQILSSDLSQLALDLAYWGVRNPQDMKFLDQPPAAALSEARNLLTHLGALDDHLTLTEKGKLMRRLALPPRLAAMVISAAAEGFGHAASQLAVLLTEQGLGGSDVDLDDRLRRFRTENGSRAEAARSLSTRIAQTLPKAPQAQGQAAAGRLLLHGFPDRVAAQRGGRGRFLLANGRGAELPETERLATSSLLVVADLTGAAARARILAAAEVTRADVEDCLGDLIHQAEDCAFEPATREVRARKQTRLGALVLAESPLPKPRGELAARALAQGVRDMGIGALAFPKDVLHLRQRINLLHCTIGEPWPDMSDDALVERLDEWFVPFQGGKTRLDEIDAGGLVQGLRSLIPFELSRELDRLAPTHFEAPTGQRHPIRYDGDEPVLAIRVQELFGTKTHPSVAGGSLPLVLELTSPAHRPIQTTRDLPGFWAGSWREVRGEMRGRYPKHPWPDDPAEAAPTTRAKPRRT
ncbi:ATP-dependent helicase HrpB [Rhizobium halophilum]|uniref:ATP-dependent helicase HrpB n=1 Tax=Rhizobium halophilum TaxID=2846852 RepID=UPI001EFC9876|nr:ATP-dependent helicase HrpB [Rhizobium halophilum]MCF6369081.1 ATP-dependent helicase HrpB [Rhizobium halophilum]